MQDIGGTPPRRNRVTYVEAGAAMRLAFERASTVGEARGKSRLNGSDWRVLAAVVALTASYSKLEDTVYTGIVARMAGFRGPNEDTNARRARRILKKLASLGIIEYEPSRKLREPSIVRLPKPANGEGVRF
jgi:hypothetical protein